MIDARETCGKRRGVKVKTATMKVKRKIERRKTESGGLAVSVAAGCFLSGGVVGNLCACP